MHYDATGGAQERESVAYKTPHPPFINPATDDGRSKNKHNQHQCYNNTDNSGDVRRLYVLFVVAWMDLKCYFLISENHRPA
jgi:hypothetical protein